MKMNKKVIGLVLAGMLSFGVVGCENNNKNVSGDDIFLDVFEDAINERWSEGYKIDKEVEEEKIKTTEEYNKKVIESIQEEVDALEKAKFNIENKELEKIADSYIQGDKLQIECFKTENIELQSKYYEESNSLRKPALISLVEDYGVQIDEEYQQTYKDFKEEATVINKEKDAKSFADKLANEMVFESSTDEFGEKVFIAIIENTSDINFKTLQYQVNYKDVDGIVIGNDYAVIENFDANTKQKVKLYPYGLKDIEKIVVTTDYFETK